MTMRCSNEDCKTRQADGNPQFYGEQHVEGTLPVVTDDCGNFITNVNDDLSQCHTLNAKNPEGPFTCTDCGHESEEV